MIHVCSYSSPLGKMLLAAEERELIGVWFEGAKYFASGLDRDSCSTEKNAVLCYACDWLDAYFEGRRPDPNALPLRLTGSSFRQSVLRSLLTIPYGETVTYGAIAKRLAVDSGRRASAQAVGGAVGHNPISVIIPCHRVLGADGGLTGYAGGVERKRLLLLHEAGQPLL